MNFAFFADIFFPNKCLACGATGASAGGAPCCAACRRTVAIAAACPSEFHAAADYGDPVVRTLIHQLKFNFMRSAAAPLGEMIADHAVRCKDIPPHFLRDAVIVPIPLSRKRLRERGFNQSALIAERVGACAGVRVLNDVLMRVRHTKPHSETASAAERRRNILGCFSVCRPPPAKIILVDDVVTTGSTFEEAIRTLRAEGAHAIVAIAAARS